MSSHRALRARVASFVRTGVPWALGADLAAALALIVALIVATRGGVAFKVWEIRFAAHDVWRPLVFAAGVVAVRLALTRRRFRLIHFAVFGLVLQMVASHYLQGAGVSALIGFGEEFEVSALESVRTHVPVFAEGAGYDGQFYAQLALDPLLRDLAIGTALDDP